MPEEKLKKIVILAKTLNLAVFGVTDNESDT